MIVNGNAGPGVAENMMSGHVHVKGDASQAAGATGCGGLLRDRRQCVGALRHLDEGHRHRGEGLGRPHVGVHGAGRQSGRARRRRRGARRFHLRGAALRARRGRRASAPTASRSRCEEHHRAELRRLLDAAGLNGEVDVGDVPALRLGAQALSLPYRQRRGRTDGARRTAGSTRRRASRRPSTTHAIAEIRRAAATGIYDIRGAGAKRKLPHFDDLLFLGASISRYPLEGYREKCGTDVTHRRALRQEADHAEDPDHHRRHELRLAVGAGQGGAGPRRQRGRHLDHHRRRRHDAGGARAFAASSSIRCCRRATA